MAGWLPEPIPCAADIASLALAQFPLSANLLDMEAVPNAHLDFALASLHAE
jgi:hypothetical protein